MKRFFQILRLKKKIRDAKLRFEATCELFIEGTFSTDDRVALKVYWEDLFSLSEAQKELNNLIK